MLDVCLLGRFEIRCDQQDISCFQAQKVQELFSFLVLFWLMKRRIGGVHGRRLRAVIVKVAAGSFLMAIAVLIVHWLVGLVATSRTMQYFGDLVLTIPAGIATVWISCRWMKVEELEMATRALGGPIVRRFSRRA